MPFPMKLNGEEEKEGGEREEGGGRGGEERGGRGGEEGGRRGGEREKGEGERRGIKERDKIQSAQGLPLKKHSILASLPVFLLSSFSQCAKQKESSNSGRLTILKETACSP